MTAANDNLKGQAFAPVLPLNLHRFDNQWLALCAGVRVSREYLENANRNSYLLPDPWNWA